MEPSFLKSKKLLMKTVKPILSGFGDKYHVAFINWSMGFFNSFALFLSLCSQRYNVFMSLSKNKHLYCFFRSNTFLIVYQVIALSHV